MPIHDASHRATPVRTMNAEDVRSGNVVCFPGGGGQYLVTRVVVGDDPVEKLKVAVIHMERPNGSEMEYNVPALKQFDVDGIVVVDGNGYRCESCEAFLHEDNPGTLNDVVGAYFCSAGGGCRT